MTVDVVICSTKEVARSRGARRDPGCPSCLVLDGRQVLTPLMLLNGAARGMSIGDVDFLDLTHDDLSDDAAVELAIARYMLAASS